jgi:hypothetical protein
MSAELEQATLAVAVIPPKPLTVIERASLVFAAVKSEDELKELAKASATIVTITNQAGFDQCHAARMVLKNERLEIARIGEDGREDAVQTSKAIIAQQKKRIGLIEPEENRLKTIQDAWDAKVAAEKEAKIQLELKRVADLQSRIVELRGCQTLSPTSGSVLIAQHIADLDKIPVDSTFEEFEQQALDAKLGGLKRLGDLHVAALDHEAKQAQLEIDRQELARLRAEQADRDRLAKEAQAKADADAKIERDRLEEIAKTERAAEAKKLADERAENDRIARDRQAELDAQAEAQRKTLADEAGRLAADRTKFEAEQEVARKAAEPKPEPVAKPRLRLTAAFDMEEIITILMGHYKAERNEVIYFLSTRRWADIAA